MKLIVLLCIALGAGAISALASSANPADSTIGTNANSNPEAEITALFGDQTLVKADGFQIKRSTYDQLVSSAKGQAAAAGQQWSPENDVLILDQLIAIQMLLQLTNADDITLGREAADEQYTNIMKQFVSPEAFERQLKAVGVTDEELRAKAVQEAVAQMALKRLLGVTVTGDEARNYYDTHPAKFEQPELVHARHILLLTIDPTTGQPLSTNTIAAKRRQIEEIRKRILAGEDFATLARQYCEDGTRENGGELPIFSRGKMVPEFEAAAFALGTNEVSDVVTTQFGFHLIKVLDKTPAKKIDFATAEPEIRQYLTQMKIHQVAPAYIQKLRAEQHVVVMDADLKSQDEQLQAQAAAAAAAAAAGTETNK